MKVLPKAVVVVLAKDKTNVRIYCAHECSRKAEMNEITV